MLLEARGEVREEEGVQEEEGEEVAESSALTR